jgi:hypothetical protein
MSLLRVFRATPTILHASSRLIQPGSVSVIERFGHLHIFDLVDTSERACYNHRGPENRDPKLSFLAERLGSCPLRQMVHGVVAPACTCLPTSWGSDTLRSIGLGDAGTLYIPNASRTLSSGIISRSVRRNNLRPVPSDEALQELLSQVADRLNLPSDEACALSLRRRPRGAL